MDVKQLVIFIFLLLPVLSCSDQNTPDKPVFAYTQEAELKFSASDNFGFIIRNAGQEKQALRLSINGRIWVSKAHLRKAVQNQRVSKALPVQDSLATKAWDFVTRHTWHGREPNQPKHLAYSPLYLLNSMGSAICSHRNALLCQVWEMLGYKSRTVDLGDHVVAEVYYQGGWHMYDADFGVFFSDAKTVLSVSQLEHKIRNAKMHSSDFVSDLQNAGLRIYPYSYFGWIESTADNQINSWFVTNTVHSDLWFDLPPGAEIRYPAKTGETHDFRLAELRITQSYTGLLHLPLLMEKSDSLRLLSPTGSDSGIFLLSGNTGRILLQANPLIWQVQSGNLLKMEKSGASSLHISTFPLEIKPYKKLSGIFPTMDSLLMRWMHANPDFADTMQISDYQSLSAFYRKLGKRIYPGDSQNRNAARNALLIDSLISHYNTDKAAFYGQLNRPFPLVVMATVLFHADEEGIKQLMWEYYGE
ncbi:MAG: hypothetical protein ACQES0_08000 [Bacteroidota bacterium]